MHSDTISSPSPQYSRLTVEKPNGLRGLGSPSCGGRCCRQRGMLHLTPDQPYPLWRLAQRTLYRRFTAPLAFPTSPRDGTTSCRLRPAGLQSPLTTLLGLSISVQVLAAPGRRLRRWISRLKAIHVIVYLWIEPGLSTRRMRATENV